MTIRPAAAADLPAIAAVYDAILDREETGPVYTNWQRGKYPTADTARQSLETGTLYVGEEDGFLWGVVTLTGIQPRNTPASPGSSPPKRSRLACSIRSASILTEAAGAWPGRWWPSARRRPAAGVKPSCGWTPGRAISRPTACIPPWATDTPALRNSFSRASFGKS